MEYLDDVLAVAASAFHRTRHLGIPRCARARAGPRQRERAVAARTARRTRTVSADARIRRPPGFRSWLPRLIRFVDGLITLLVESAFGTRTRERHRAPSPRRLKTHQQRPCTRQPVHDRPRAGNAEPRRRQSRDDHDEAEDAERPRCSRCWRGEDEDQPNCDSQGGDRVKSGRRHYGALQREPQIWHRKAGRASEDDQCANKDQAIAWRVLSASCRAPLPPMTNSVVSETQR